MSPRPARAGVLLVALLGSCIDVADERVVRDLAVGHAESGAIRVDVDEGAAVVRALAPGALHLRANAPELRASVAGLGGGAVVRIQNVLPDAELVVNDEAGAPVAVTRLPGAVATDRSWSLPALDTSRLVLRLVAPDAAQVSPFRFAVYGDVQDAIDRVQDIYGRMNEEPDVRFALLVGDLTERGGDDELERFARELEPLRLPVYTTLGNHELGKSNGDPGYHRWFGRGSFRFVFRGVQFTMLDSASATLAPQVYDWLDGWLAEGAARAHVVGMHIPPVDPVGVRSGSFASRAEADKLLARLSRGNVDLTVYGHVHSYYAFANAGGFPPSSRAAAARSPSGWMASGATSSSSTSIPRRSA